MQALFKSAGSLRWGSSNGQRLNPPKEHLRQANQLCWTCRQNLQPPHTLRSLWNGDSTTAFCSCNYCTGCATAAAASCIMLLPLLLLLLLLLGVLLGWPHGCNWHKRWQHVSCTFGVHMSRSDVTHTTNNAVAPYILPLAATPEGWFAAWHLPLKPKVQCQQVDLT
jgi:hypothetical protein